MDILYVCTEGMQRSYILEEIFNKICTTSNIAPYVKNISVNSNIFHQLKNNVFLLLDKIRKIIVFK